jgi:hypothetical protein
MGKLLKILGVLLVSMSLMFVGCSDDKDNGCKGGSLTIADSRLIGEWEEVEDEWGFNVPGVLTITANSVTAVGGERSRAGHFAWNIDFLISGYNILGIPSANVKFENGKITADGVVKYTYEFSLNNNVLTIFDITFVNVETEVMVFEGIKKGSGVNLNDAIIGVWGFGGEPLVEFTATEMFLFDDGVKDEEGTAYRIFRANILMVFDEMEMASGFDFQGGKVFFWGVELAKI